MNVTVTGDITVDWIQWPVKEDADVSRFNWKSHLGFKRKALRGGALLLADMLSTSLRVNHPELEVEPENTDPSEFIHSFAELEDSGKGYHVKRFLGYTGPEDGLPGMPFKFRDSEADVLVIDDAGNGFREMNDKWPSSLRNEETLIVLKMSSPLFTGSLWRYLAENHRENLITIVTVDDLREFGANISRRLSWEKTAEDFMWQMNNNPAMADLRDLNMVVRIGLEGAVHYSGGDARLFYHPHLFEGNLFERSPGKMQGYGCAFTAGFTESICRGHDIDDAVRSGMTASMNLHRKGFTRKPDYPLNIFKAGDISWIGSVKIPHQGRELWTIADSPPIFDIESVSRHIVINGYRQRRCPLPIAHFGKLITADRTEIEGYQSIRNLMIEYLKTENPERPLCIGVFGPPGAGKSFAVKQLAASVDPERIEHLNFNISQFRDEEDLIDAFHQIDREVLNAFLKIPEYRHGVRSMEAILDMSILQDVKRFEKSSLPPAGQLDLHVDGELFHRMVMEN